jgi:hypothetical protein
MLPFGDVGVDGKYISDNVFAVAAMREEIASGALQGRSCRLPVSRPSFRKRLVSFAPNIMAP